MRQLTAPGGARPAARFWTRSLSEYRGAPRLPRGATSVCGSRRATASPGRDERWGSRRATASPGRDERVWVEARHGFAGARRALGVEARHGFAGARRALGGMGGHFGAPNIQLVEHHRIAGRAGGANDPQRRPDERALEDLLVD